jgi:hypothetical protein
MRLTDTNEATTAHNTLVVGIVERHSPVRFDNTKLAAETQEASTHYADAIASLWPLNTPVETIKSAASIELQRDQLTETRYARVTAALIKRATVLCVAGQVHMAREAVKTEMSTCKSAAAGPTVATYALPVYNELPLHTEKYASESIQSFCQNRERFTYEMRKEAATSLLAAADLFRIDLSETETDTLQRSAGQGYGHVNNISDQLGLRSLKIARQNAVYARNLADLADEIGGSEAHALTLSDEALVKLAVTIDYADKTYGITHGEEFKIAEDVVFEYTHRVMTKAAEGVVPIGGYRYRREDLQRLPSDALGFVKLSTTRTRLMEPVVDQVLAAVKTAGADVVNRVLHNFHIQPMDQPRERPQHTNRGEFDRWAHIVDEYAPSTGAVDYGNQLEISLSSGITTLCN